MKKEYTLYRQTLAWIGFATCLYGIYWVVTTYLGPILGSALGALGLTAIISNY